MGRVFVSYRRSETRHIAGRLADRLEDRLGSTQVFMDVDAIQPGADFADAIVAAVASCDVLIALVGPTWTTVADAFGRRRLDDPNDFVVLEISAALERGILVVPVLVDGAPMPRQDQLPPPLRGLARRQAVRIDHETFRSDVEPLLVTIQRSLDGQRLPSADDVRRPAPRPAIPTQNAALPVWPTTVTSTPPPTRRSGLTPADVHNVAFAKPPVGKRGYNEDEVDAILDLVEAALAGEAVRLTASDVQNVTFSKPPIGKRGYNEDQVDAFLDLVVAEMVARGLTGASSS